MPLPVRALPCLAQGLLLTAGGEYLCLDGRLLLLALVECTGLLNVLTSNIENT